VSRAFLAALAVVSLPALAACSKSNNSTGPSTSACTAGPTSTTITIANNAVCPQNITVARGTQVTFVNQDSVAHEMFSDPHPEHTDCLEINQVGHLEPNQSHQTGNLNTARTCGFHDHQRPDVAGLKGSIRIQ
jgi:plastocyanin